MNEKPILFSASMVRAILDDRKSQTRRVVKPQPSLEWMPIVGTHCPTLIDCDGEAHPGLEQFGASDENECRKFPYGRPGDRLWVRETWKPHLAGPISPEYPLGTCVKYRADGAMFKPTRWTADQGAWCENWEEDTKWHPSIFMPRWASRITLEIVAVRLERLNDISEVDALAEGAVTRTYRAIWESINGPGSWALNPWVWVIEFKRV